MTYAKEKGQRGLKIERYKWEKTRAGGRSPSTYNKNTKSALWESLFSIILFRVYRNGENLLGGRRSLANRRGASSPLPAPLPPVLPLAPLAAADWQSPPLLGLLALADGSGSRSGAAAVAAVAYWTTLATAAAMAGLAAIICRSHPYCMRGRPAGGATAGRGVTGMAAGRQTPMSGQMGSAGGQTGPAGGPMGSAGGRMGSPTAAKVSDLLVSAAPGDIFATLSRGRTGSHTLATAYSSLLVERGEKQV